MLAYTDPEAATNANPALINDLNLKLISPSGTEFLPLTLNPSTPSANASPAVNNRDNVEQVVLQNPSAGNWTIQVTAPTVPQGPQGYAVSWLLPTINVEVSQVLNDAVTTVGTVDRWNGSAFSSVGTLPATIPFAYGTTEILKGD
jgi:subtilisin-like proprotein convertase family protein